MYRISNLIQAILLSFLLLSCAPTVGTIKSNSISESALNAKRIFLVFSDHKILQKYSYLLVDTLRLKEIEIESYKMNRDSTIIGPTASHQIDAFQPDVVIHLSIEKQGQANTNFDARVYYKNSGKLIWRSSLIFKGGLIESDYKLYMQEYVEQLMGILMKDKIL